MGTSAIRRVLSEALGQTLTPELAASIEMAAYKNDIDKLGIEFHGGDDESGDVFAVVTKAQAGETLESHVHEHSHMSVLASGIADVTIAGKTERHVGPCHLTVPKNTQHAVHAVTDVTWYCLWAGNLAPREQAEQSLRLVAA